MRPQFFLARGEGDRRYLVPATLGQGDKPPGEDGWKSNNMGHRSEKTMYLGGQGGTSQYAGHEWGRGTKGQRGEHKAPLGDRWDSSPAEEVYGWDRDTTVYQGDRRASLVDDVTPANPVPEHQEEWVLPPPTRLAPDRPPPRAPPHAPSQAPPRDPPRDPMVVADRNPVTESSALEPFPGHPEKILLTYPETAQR